MSFRTKRINDVTVKSVKPLKEEDTRPIRGAELFPEIYSNILFCAKKKKGKTSALFKSLRSTAGLDTKIIVFCSTLHKDPSWEVIQDWADRKGLPFLGYTSLKEGKEDKLMQLIEELQEPLGEEGEKIPNIFEEEEEEEAPKKKTKYRYPEYIIVLDDLSNELKSKSITSL